MSTMLTPAGALALVTARDGNGIHASAGNMYGNAIFGRDSLEVAEDLIQTHPELVRRILLNVASMQGVGFNPESEEEPGRILHEYRPNQIEGQELKGVARVIYEELSSKWGGTDKYMIYYGSVDSTPLFIKVLCSFADYKGIDVFSEKYIDRRGEEVTLWHALEAATNWLRNRLHGDSNGLLSFKRSNPHGLINQVWKDSWEFYVHEDGSEINHDGPVASIELQGLAYDALMSAVKYLPDTEDLHHIAEHITSETIRRFWMPDKAYFSVGIDTDEQGNLRPIKVITANPGALLNSSIFDNLSELHKRRYVSAIVRKLFSEDLLTNAGIRSRALSEGRLRPHWDYHGSFVTWPKETFDIATGLRRQGLFRLALQLEFRLLNLVWRAQAYPEFAYIDGQGRALLGPQSNHDGDDVITVRSTDHPEDIQAWTVSAVISTLNRLGITSDSDEWHQELQSEILQHIPITRPLATGEELMDYLPQHPYRIEANKTDRLKQGAAEMVPEFKSISH